MFTILNRLRGTHGLWSKIIGLLLALLVQIAYGNPYVSVAVCLGYIIGESFGWGEWVGCLTGSRENVTNKTEDEGANNGIQWLSRKLVPNYLTDGFLNYCRVALTIRGFYWWFLTLAPLYFVGVSIGLLSVMVLLLSVGFPLACELGYISARYFSFNKYGFSVVGGWEHQEVWYGLIQDLVIIGGLTYELVH